MFSFTICVISSYGPYSKVSGWFFFQYGVVLHINIGESGIVTGSFVPSDISRYSKQLCSKHTIILKKPHYLMP